MTQESHNRVGFTLNLENTWRYITAGSKQLFFKAFLQSSGSAANIYFYFTIIEIVVFRLGHFISVWCMINLDSLSFQIWLWESDAFYYSVVLLFSSADLLSVLRLWRSIEIQ